MTIPPRELSPDAIPSTEGAASASVQQGRRRKLERARWAVATIPPTRSRGVLVVEDDPDLQWQLARMLTVRGNRVVGTSSAEAALELIRQWPVDLVLVDDELPGMGGVELAEVIGREHGDIPVVLMASAESGRASLSETMASVVAVMVKPFRIEAMVELLRSFPKAASMAGDPSADESSVDLDLAPAE